MTSHKSHDPIENRELAAYTAMPANLATIGFGIPISDGTRYNWADALVLIQRVDDIRDSGGQEATAEMLGMAEQIISGEAYMVPKEMRRALGETALESAWRLKDSLSVEQAQKFIRLGRYIIGLRPLMAEETDIRSYAEYTQREAEVMALMMGSVMSDEEREHPNYQNFMEFLKTGGASYNLYDSVIDLKADHRTGLTLIEPSVPNRLHMSAELLKTLPANAPDVIKLSPKLKLWATLLPPLRILIADRFRGAKARPI